MKKYLAIGMMLAFLGGFVLAQAGEKQEEGRTQTQESPASSQEAKTQTKTDQEQRNAVPQPASATMDEQAEKEG